MKLHRNLNRRVLALVLLCAMLAALLCSCGSQVEEGEKPSGNAPTGMNPIAGSDTLEKPGFSIIGGNDDPFVVPDVSEDVSDSEPLNPDDYRPGENPDYTLDHDTPTFDPIEDYSPTIPHEMLGQNMTVLFTVMDTEGYPIKGARITLGDYHGTTNENGELSLQIKTGVYEFDVVAVGFTPYSEDLTVNLNDTEIGVMLANSNKIRVLLDSADLHPYVTDYPEVEAYLDKLFDVLFEDDMDTYDKVLACYDYIIAHTDYKQPKHWISGKEYWPCSLQSFQEGIGVCNCYSAMFTVMLRHIGLDCSIVTGYTTSIRGGYTSHDWTTVCIGGKYYIFDCQVEDAIADRTSSKEVKYLRFCLDENHPKYRYTNKSLKSCIADFEKYLLAHGHFVG